MKNSIFFSPLQQEKGKVLRIFHERESKKKKKAYHKNEMDKRKRSDYPTDQPKEGPWSGPEDYPLFSSYLDLLWDPSAFILQTLASATVLSSLC